MSITISGDGTVQGPVTIKAAEGQTEPILELQQSDGTIVQSTSAAGSITIVGIVESPTISDIEAVALLGL